MPRHFAVSTRTTSFAAILLLSSSTMSFAIEASAVVERFAEFNKTQGQTLAYEAIENENGDSFTVKGASITFPNGKPVNIANIQFNGVLENSDGSISVNSVRYENISFSSEQVSVTMGEAALDNFTLPSKTNPDAVRSMVYFSGLSGSDIKIVVAGKQVASMAVLKVNYGEITSDKPIAMNGELSGVSLDLSDAGDARFKGMMGALGYDGKFSGQLLLGGSWNPADGRMSVDKYDIQLDNVGTLSVLFTISGYTTDLAKRIQKASQGTSGSQAAGMAMMQELPNLFFESAKISFKDDSITNRVLKMQAAQMGGTPDDVAKMVPVMLPLVLGGLGNPEFTTMVQGAAGRFVAEPGNITISAKPEKPMAFSELMGIGMAAPTSLIGTLAVNVTANE